MRYWLDLFTPETWTRFQAHGSSISGFPTVMKNQAREIEVGDIFICYMVRLSRFCGVLRCESKSFEDHTPIFADENDPFPVRLRVSAECLLEPQYAIPVLEDDIWNNLSLTKDRNQGRGWGMVFRRSLRTFTPEDGQFLEARLKAQAHSPVLYPLSDADQRHLRARPRRCHVVRSGHSRGTGKPRGY